jgi:hypothetical protein
MAAPSIRLAGPAFLAASATNLYTPPSSSQVTLRTYITQIHFANVTTGAVTWTAYIGGTGGSTAGTELGKGVSVAANSVSDLYFGDGIEMLTTDFLTGLASAASSITVVVSGYVQAV